MKGSLNVSFNELVKTFFCSIIFLSRIVITPSWKTIRSGVQSLQVRLNLRKIKHSFILLIKNCKNVSKI